MSKVTNDDRETATTFIAIIRDSGLLTDRSHSFLKDIEGKFAQLLADRRQKHLKSIKDRAYEALSLVNSFHATLKQDHETAQNRIKQIIKICEGGDDER